MRLKVEHSTFYAFDKKVFLEPHYLKFTPAPRPYYHLEKIEIAVNPKPSGLVERSGLENNIYQQAWFNEVTDYLKIDVKLELLLEEFNPFGFYVDMKSGASPNDFYKPEEKSALFLYLNPIGFSSKMTKWSNEIRKSTGDNFITYLSFLNQTIHSEIKHEIREEDNLMSPGLLFDNKVGSCRDLSWFMIHVLRNQGIAARYVSGYSYNPELEEGHELHAWVEAYLPGGGWIGLDPSAGIFATETHIPICASYNPEMTKPVTGAYRGNAKGSMKTNVQIGLEG